MAENYSRSRLSPPDCVFVFVDRKVKEKLHQNKITLSGDKKHIFTPKSFYRYTFIASRVMSKSLSARKKITTMYSFTDVWSLLFVCSRLQSTWTRFRVRLRRQNVVELCLPALVCLREWKDFVRSWLVLILASWSVSLVIRRYLSVHVFAHETLNV